MPRWPSADPAPTSVARPGGRRVGASTRAVVALVVGTALAALLPPLISGASSGCPVGGQSPPVVGTGSPPVGEQSPPVVGEQSPPVGEQSPPVGDQSPPCTTCPDGSTPVGSASPPVVGGQSPPVGCQSPPVTTCPPTTPVAARGHQEPPPVGCTSPPVPQHPARLAAGAVNVVEPVGRDQLVAAFVPITLSRAVPHAVTITVSVHDSTHGRRFAGLSDIRWDLSDHAVVVPAGATSGWARIWVRGDGVAEGIDWLHRRVPAEVLRLDLATTDPDVTPAHVGAAVNISEFSHGGMVIGSMVLPEGGPGPHVVQIPLTLARTWSHDLVVRYHLVGAGARPGVDYVADHGSVTIPAGRVDGVIPVTVLGDDGRDHVVAPEIVQVVVDSVDGAPVARPSYGIVVILDDDRG